MFWNLYKGWILTWGYGRISFGRIFINWVYLEGKSITGEEAFDILGEDNFFEGVERAIMHCDAVCESDDGREVFMEQK